MAMSVAIIRQLFFKSSVIMAHFGRNPVSGGKPPRDSKVNDVIIRIAGVLFHKSEIELIVVDEFNIIARNIGIVIAI